MARMRFTVKAWLMSLRYFECTGGSVRCRVETRAQPCSLR